MKKLSPGAALAAMRWSKPGADRDQPRRAGQVYGGRPVTCECGECDKCRRRTKRRASVAAKKATP